MAREMKNVLIIGGGNIGTAVRSLLDPSAASVSVIDSKDERCVLEGAKEEVVSTADVVFFCVHSGRLEEAISGVEALLPKDALIVVLTKGMMEGNLFMHEYLAARLLQKFYFLYGPMLAREISGGLGTGATLAGRAEHHRELLELFDKSKILIETTEDTAGVAVLGVIKNVYTIMLSMIETLEAGDNYYGAIFSRIVREAGSIVTHFNGQESTALGFAGVGDLIATSRSPFSSNKTFAIEMVQGKTCTIKAEGPKALPALLARLSSYENELPVMKAVDKVCLQGEHLESTVLGLLKVIR